MVLFLSRLRQRGERILFLGTSTPYSRASYSPKLYSIVLANGHVAERNLGEGWCIRCARWVPGGRQIAVIGAFRSPITVLTTDLWVVEVGWRRGAICRSMDVRGRVGFRIHHDMPLWDAPWFHDIVFPRCTYGVGDRTEAVEGPKVWAISLSGPPLCERVLGGRSFVCGDQRERRQDSHPLRRDRYSDSHPNCIELLRGPSTASHPM